STGYNNGSIAYFMIFQNPNVDLNWYRNIWQKGEYQLQQIQPFSSYIDNPYLIAYEATNPLSSHQLIGTISAEVELADHWHLRLRTSLNSQNSDREQQRPYIINRHARDFYKKQNIYKHEINFDFLRSYHNQFNENWDFSASAGGNAMQFKYRRTDAAIDGLVVPGVYKLSNGINNPTVS